MLVGHSLGGYAAMAYAASLPGRARRARARAARAPTPTGPGAAVYRGVAALTDRLGPERMTRVNDRVLRRLYPPDRIEPVIAGGYYFDPTRGRVARGHDALPADDAHEVSCPVLLLNGQFDQFRVGTRAYLRACPQARVEIVRRAGHLANLDQPEAFADALLRFAGSPIRRRAPDRGESWP